MDPAATAPLKTRTRLAPEYIRTTIRKGKNGAAKTRLGSFFPRNTTTSQHDPVEMVIDHTQFDILAAGFQLETVKSGAREWRKIPHEVLEGIETHARIERETNVRPE